MTSGALDLEGFSRAVGAGNVITDGDALAGYRAGGDMPAAALAIVKPAGTKELRQVVLEARRTGANLIFSSSAPPRYRGDSAPSEDGVIVDLSGMDRILHVDRRNKVAYIEPGVTYGTLSEAAGRAGLKVLMPLLPKAGRSVIAGCLEREPIIIPKYHWDMTDPLLCTEMVFGSGEVHRTGTAGSPGTIDMQIKAGLAHKNPMGPGASDFLRMVQGSQGTLAGVTWATVKLEIEPSLHEIAFATADELSPVVEFTYSSLKPRVGDEWLILNARALANVIGAEPGAVRGPEAVAATPGGTGGDAGISGPNTGSRHAAGIDGLAELQAPWTVVCGVSGYKYRPAERLALQKGELAGRARAAGVKIAPDVPGCDGGRMAQILAAPSREPYYRTAPRGAFRELFFLSTLDRAESLIEVMEAECESGGYPARELGIYMQPVQQGRAAHVEFTLYYDPDDGEAGASVQDVLASAPRALDEAGAFFSRPHGSWSEVAYGGCPDTVAALEKVKRVMDPDNVLNRGKLCFAGEVV